MGIVVDVNIVRLPLLFKAIEIDALLVVLTHIITNNHVPVLLLHDAAKPQVVVTVVILEECIHAVIVGIKSSTILSALHVCIGFIELDLDAIGIEAENTVPCAVSTTVGQSIALIDGVVADSRNDVVASSMVYVVVCHVQLSSTGNGRLCHAS